MLTLDDFKNPFIKTALFIARGKTVMWDLKFDGNADGIPDYLEAAQIGRSCGLECGAFWTGFQDYPHMQLPDKG
jgi:hypothetical protein